MRLLTRPPVNPETVLFYVPKLFEKKTNKQATLVHFTYNSNISINIKKEREERRNKKKKNGYFFKKNILATLEHLYVIQTQSLI